MGRKYKERPLSPRQDRFCVEYAATGSAEKAALAAGYAKSSAIKTSHLLLRRPQVQARLKELADFYASERIATVQEMQMKLTSIIRQEATEEKIITLFQGDYSEVQKIDKHPDLKDVLTAINTLGKMQGAFSERVTLDILPTVIKDDISE